VKNCSTEYGVICARELCVNARKIKGTKQLGEQEIIVAMKRGKFILNATV
jgi:hypothetical protein